ncbi:RNA polymerase sigma factor SigZ [Parasedimentitalea marina]|uniref:RNA polymerase sigma factor SigZ n=1 Tax=Parasedimentitalea marina TaxID=2483033 RepID=A0A3T0N1X1_9RHOB|nr:RNA polymerase sigma factor SigZ [Parasedimentitalea marina]AZV77989.1 RNA polymerase sigma factor SigZ [Parasedimentitalea marina]
MDVEKIWFEYRARIKAFLHSRVSNVADVEDLLQEISIKTFVGISALDDPSKVQSWLFQTAHRTIIDFYRKNGSAKDMHADDLWYSEDEPETRHELERCVEPFIAALPSETAQLLTAIDIEGQSQKDYAAAHGLPYSTLKTRVKNGRRALRSVFDNCCRFTLDSRGNLSEYHSKSDSCENC